MIKRGIRGHDLDAVGLENIAKLCRDNNIEYIQLALDRSEPDFKIGLYSKEYAESLKSQLGDRKVGILASYINPSNPNSDELKTELDKFKDKIKYAKTLKPIAVGTETGTYKPGETNSEEAYQYVLKNIKELVSFAEENGVTVAVEGVWCFVINTPKKLHRLVTDINSDNLKVIFDPVNYLNDENYEKQDEIIEEMFELLADKIVAIHGKDFVIEDGHLRHSNIVPGAGNLNYKLIFKKMKEYKVDVPIISEELCLKDAVAGLDTIEKLF